MLDESARQSSSPEGQVLNAVPALPGDWPATFVFLTEGGGCTSTAIGRKVVITAAHCVRDRQDARVVVGNTGVALSCYHHPDYLRDISADYALCLLDSSLPNLDSGFERINSSRDIIRPPARLLLLGYGCTTNQGQRDFGKLYQGFSTVEENSAANLYIHTKGGAAGCFGDSGGGAYWIESEQEIKGKRLLVGITSKGDVSTNSWLSSTAATSFFGWARSWAADRAVTICGVPGPEDNCRPG